MRATVPKRLPSRAGRVFWEDVFLDSHIEVLIRCVDHATATKNRGRLQLGIALHRERDHGKKSTLARSLRLVKVAAVDEREGSAVDPHIPL